MVQTTVYTAVQVVVKQIETKIQKGTGTRHTIYIKKELMDDSSFPFKAGEELVLRIDGEKLVIEKSKK